MRYDKDKGEFMSHTITKNNTMEINIKTDGDNFINLCGKGTLRSVKLSSQEVISVTGAYAADQSMTSASTASMKKGPQVRSYYVCHR